MMRSTTHRKCSTLCHLPFFQYCRKMSVSGGPEHTACPAKSISGFRFMGLLYVISPFLSRYALPSAKQEMPEKSSPWQQETSREPSPLTNRRASGRLIKAYLFISVWEIHRFCRRWARQYPARLSSGFPSPTEISTSGGSRPCAA